MDGRKDLHSSENNNTLEDGCEENAVNVEDYHLDGEHSMVIPLVMVILIAILIGNIIGNSALFKNQVNTTSCKPDDFLPLARERYHPHKALNPVRYSFAIVS